MRRLRRLRRLRLLITGQNLRRYTGQHDCRPPLHFSQVHVRACLEEKANQSERDLKQAEQNAISALAQWDEDDRFSRAARAGLSTSNKSFTQYREAQCKFSASLNGGAAGNSHEIRRLACIAELNSKRAEQLRSAASELPSK
ncbi:lysozyme inhibitor LprI family protein [Caballeronia sp. GAOx1]|uniref:lysozyme inhibitor LprI family protein n=1 Tax=Caballeronia sp. GAOx1 TaxID=2921761 RepID=UPI0020276EFC|nr:lysozyme inhibitor LprI family protein [Caballeronia sp. GAOx1]